MEFLYTKKNDTICLDKVKEPEPEVNIPERIEGLLVTELGPYVLSGSGVEEVHIPSQVRKIGAYAFYNCEKLRKIYCYGRAVDLGTGIFADDRKIAFLDLTLYAGERSCMKEMLSEIRQTLRVQIHEVKADPQEKMIQEAESTSEAAETNPMREARMIFPEYFEESVENTPARKLYVETHGCGQRYRYCFVRREFQYADYDALFSHVQVQESEKLVAELAIGRIRYPRELGSRSRECYVQYLREHWQAAAGILLQADKLSSRSVTNLDAGMLPWFLEQILETPTKEQLRVITEQAQKLGNTEMVSYLMDYRHTHFAAAQTEECAERSARRRRFEL